MGLEEELKKFTHDVNNKLCILKFRVKNLKNDCCESDYEKKLSAEKMLSCITDISTLCEDLKESPRKYDLNKMISNIVNSFSDFSMCKPLKIKFKAKNKGFYLFCKPSEIDRIFTNFFKNSQEAGATNALIVLSDKSLYYYDNGPGFSQKVLDSIKTSEITFSTKADSGRGLGTQSVLSICKKRKWDITFKNRPNNKGVNIIIDFNN